jgi:hypothetical protein
MVSGDVSETTIVAKVPLAVAVLEMDPASRLATVVV